MLQVLLFRRLHLLIGLIVISGWSLLSDDSLGQSVILRDLTRITDNPVKEFDSETITLGDGTRLEWQQVLSADVGVARQHEFDELIRKIGLPKFRLETRIRQKDWVGALEIAEPVFEQYCSGDSDLDSRYVFLCALATHRGRWQKVQREKSVLPYLLAVQLSQVIELHDDEKELLALNVTTDFANHIVPIWFDKSAAREAGDQLNRLIESKMIKPTSVSLTYAASLAIAADNAVRAKQLLDRIDRSIDTEKDLKVWLNFVEAYYRFQFEAPDQALAVDEVDLVANSPVPIAIIYLRGMSMGSGVAHDESGELSSEDRAVLSNAMIELLTIPALYENQHPDLSAAALFQATSFAERLGRARDVRILRNELLTRFPKTYHASQTTTKVK